MEYTIKQLASLAKISTRTLRYYDEIGLLPPKRINESGYRIYGQHEVDQLQQILYFKELDMTLEHIRTILSHPSYDSLALLEQHKEALLLKREHLDGLIANVERTIASKKGKIIMSNKEKFSAFMHDNVQKNEEKYGKKIREQFGEETMDTSNQSFLNMSENDFSKHQQLEEELLVLLTPPENVKVPSDEAEKIFSNHQQWIKNAWGKYSFDAHVGLAMMYTQSEEFTSYYDDKCGVSATKKLQEIISHYAK